MVRRKANGEGTIYRRKDGRYEGAAYFRTTTGRRRRMRVYGGTRAEVVQKMTAALAQADRGIAISDASWTVGAYLDHWLAAYVYANKRPTTYNQYERAVRRHLKPGLGAHSLVRLSVATVQGFLDDQLARGESIRSTQVIRTVLSAALTRAMREELVTRNVARLVELPKWERKEIHPWSTADGRRFLDVTKAHPLHGAFMLLLLYGLRRGEVLGLRWEDVDVGTGELRIRQQLVRAGKLLYQGQLKTRAGRRDLPLVGLVQMALEHQAARQREQRAQAADSWHAPEPGSGLVFTTATGNPIEPRNFGRSFEAVCRQHQLRVIAMHHLRHTAATLLKDLGVPVRNAQLILGHSRITTTMEIYQHDDMDARRDALNKVERLFLRAVDGNRCRQNSRQGASARSIYNVSNSGGAWRIRTAHLLRAMNPQHLDLDPVTETLVLLKERTGAWFLGRVAVRSSRQALPSLLLHSPHELWRFASEWVNSQSEGSCI